MSLSERRAPSEAVSNTPSTPQPKTFVSLGVVCELGKLEMASAHKLKRIKEGWRDASEVKSTYRCSRGPEFNSQQPHGSSQPSVMRSDAFFWCLKTATMYSYT
jgi:hypothetical protein